VSLCEHHGLTVQEIITAAAQITIQRDNPPKAHVPMLIVLANLQLLWGGSAMGVPASYVVAKCHFGLLLNLYYDTFVRKDPPFVMEQRRQRLEESQARNNTEIIDYFSQLMTTTPPDLNPAFKLTIFGQVHTHVIKSLAWSGACPIEEDLLRVFEAEVRPRHGCQLDDAAKSCYDFWWQLSHWSTRGCGPCLFRACGWRYEDADGRVLEKN
jgi:hypothetical protein